MLPNFPKHYSFFGTSALPEFLHLSFAFAGMDLHEDLSPVSGVDSNVVWGDNSEGSRLHARPEDPILRTLYHKFPSVKPTSITVPTPPSMVFPRLLVLGRTKTVSPTPNTLCAHEIGEGVANAWRTAQGV